MKIKVIYIIVSLSIVSCKNLGKDKNTLDVAKFEQKEKIQKDTISISSNIKEENKINKTLIENKCDCNSGVRKLSHHLDLTFSNNGGKFSLDTLFKWKSNPKRLKIKSLYLIDFDTIPNEMKIFENVERISLRGINSNNIFGLEMFNKLKILETQMLWEFDLSNNPKWLKNIEIIHSNKTKFIGLKSFKQLPNLKEIVISFSGFEPFPKDFESLKCLKHFQTSAHRFGEINLNNIDLNKMNCLDYVEFHSWWKNIRGIPKGIRNVKKVIIHHGNLTKSEKEILKKVTGG